MSIEESRLWRGSLGLPRQLRAEVEAVERLRSSLATSRRYVQQIAAQIGSDLPQYTVHDISHIDALWETADLIAGDGLNLNPLEAYLFGMSVLVHDLGMTAAAYSGGESELRSGLSWDDAVVVEYRRRFSRNPEDSELANPDPNVAESVRAMLLREQHAARAKQIATDEYGSGASRGFLIADPELRANYGLLVGRLGASHWSDVSTVAAEFSNRIGAPGDFPAEWTVDPLVVACLLRCADASHLDARRAPYFLRLVRDLGETASEHWGFQQRLQRPYVDDGRLVFTSPAPFPFEDAGSWWLCLDAVRMVDSELRSVDRTLADAGRARFAASAVAAVDDPKRFAQLVPTVGWEPLDVRVAVGDVGKLVEKLGGRELYGDDPLVPLRELIANGIDAVNARLAIERARDQVVRPGRVSVRVDADSCGEWLVVNDDGVGMSRETLVGWLVKFGESFWTSDEARLGMPGLWSGGFEAIGRFGIGFFSVFMIGDRVKVISRDAHAGRDQTSVLEFGSGVRSRPIMRLANESEKRSSTGTELAVLVRPGQDGDGFVANVGRHYRFLKSLQDVCRYVAPCVGVDLVVSEGAVETTVVGANDWVDLPAEALIRRLYEFPSISQNGALGVAVSMSSRIGDVRDESGAKSGRLALCHIVDKADSMFVGAVVVASGLRTGSQLGTAIGVVFGDVAGATRVVARPRVSRASLREWSSDQAMPTGRSEHWQTRLAHGIAIVRCGGDPRDLPIAQWSMPTGIRLLNSDDLRALANEEPTGLALCSEGAANKARVRAGHPTSREVVIESPTYLALSFTDLSGDLGPVDAGTVSEMPSTDPAERIAGIIAEAWGFQARDGVDLLRDHARRVLDFEVSGDFGYDDDGRRVYPLDELGVKVATKADGTEVRGLGVLLSPATLRDFVHARDA